MTKRVCLVTAVLVASAVAVVLWQSRSAAEPVFEGRPLTSWLESHLPNSSANPPYNSPGWKKADQALRQIGTNGIPTLLRMIRAKDPPPLLVKVMSAVRLDRWIRKPYRRAYQLNEEAEYAFKTLGTNAASAVPELIRIYENNVSPSSRRCAAQALGHIGRAAEPAIPVLYKHFTHTNSDVRFYAVSAVADIGGDPALVVPALTSVLSDPRVSVRWNAVSGLSHFGSRARSAVPRLMEMLNDRGMSGTYSITQQVETTLWRIAPEKVGQPLVVEESTPILTNGVTSQAVKFLFYGKHQTLVPIGTSVPAVRQYWSSDPRPRLTVYRGASATNGPDHLLGHFEVQDVAAAPNVNISTLCIIVDGKILLAARDNTRERFLAIRRVEE